MKREFTVFSRQEAVEAGAPRTEFEGESKSSKEDALSNASSKEESKRECKDESKSQGDDGMSSVLEEKKESVVESVVEEGSEKSQGALNLDEAGSQHESAHSHSNQALMRQKSKSSIEEGKAPSLDDEEASEHSKKSWVRSEGLSKVGRQASKTSSEVSEKSEKLSVKSAKFSVKSDKVSAKSDKVSAKSDKVSAKSDKVSEKLSKKEGVEDSRSEESVSDKASDRSSSKQSSMQASKHSSKHSSAKQLERAPTDVAAKLLSDVPSDAHSDNHSDEKSEANSELKSDGKSDVKSEAKSDAKSIASLASKTASKTEASKTFVEATTCVSEKANIFEKKPAKVGKLIGLFGGQPGQEEVKSSRRSDASDTTPPTMPSNVPPVKKLQNNPWMRTMLNKNAPGSENKSQLEKTSPANDEQPKDQPEANPFKIAALRNRFANAATAGLNKPEPRAQPEVRDAANGSASAGTIAGRSGFGMGGQSTGMSTGSRLAELRQKFNKMPVSQSKLGSKPGVPEKTAFTTQPPPHLVEEATVDLDSEKSLETKSSARTKNITKDATETTEKAPAQTATPKATGAAAKVEKIEEETTKQEAGSAVEPEDNKAQKSILVSPDVPADHTQVSQDVGLVDADDIAVPPKKLKKERADKKKSGDKKGASYDESVSENSSAGSKKATKAGKSSKAEKKKSKSDKRKVHSRSAAGMPGTPGR
uniref:Uncharacterized protein n=1 Tax=uncultured organism MedDCM-OCT-S09-C171 TaxID=743644 RepID=D6PJC8_9ZZZZ|nr:hypothetical protein [uncultured organism MedDCM-OCT-S09-C171]